MPAGYVAENAEYPTGCVAPGKSNHGTCPRRFPHAWAGWMPSADPKLFAALLRDMPAAVGSGDMEINRCTRPGCQIVEARWAR
jgi:hypothetical protein